ncbi:hypothetical protein [Paracraurococcus lichenis]|uniref:Uncharacterized protein n=1 Tax=Paracraurococcus lichenis TaxID=3064888 RepID=A0ABT9EEE7_9PROT|nr:hypothetical protein [Paracraurococcus sp. LOR1-02]MDO9714587.1 hypothetical protein [Paracraurococcus sp. LOR1-02]
MDPVTEPPPTRAHKRVQIRRRTLPPERREEFNRRALAGEDLRRLARLFNLELCYARRHLDRLLTRTNREMAESPCLPTREAPVPEGMTPLEYAHALLGRRVRQLRNGYYELDGFPAGPREVTRAANHLLRSRGDEEIPYPGLVPLRR